MALDLFLGGRNNPLDGSNNNHPVLGSQVERFIEVRNLGPGAETNVVIDSLLPSNVTARTWEIVTDTTAGGIATPDGPQVGPINVTVASMADGDQIIIEFTDTYGAVGSDDIEATASSTQTPLLTSTQSPPNDGVSFDLDCNPAQDITDRTAELRATVDGTANGTRGLGFRWGTTPGGPYPNVAPAGFSVDGTWTIAGNGVAAQQYGVIVDGLTPSTTYYYVPTTSTGNGLQDPSPAPAECSFTTDADNQADAVCTGATGITDDGATLNGQTTQAVVGPGDYFFRWGENVPGPVELPNQTAITAVPAGVLTPVSAVLAGLTQLTEYRYRLFVRDQGGVVRSVSELCLFTTLETLFDDIQCDPADNITTDGGRMLATGDNVDPSASVRFRWGTTPGGPYPNVGLGAPGNNTVGQQFNTTATGLPDNTPIYYIAEVIDGPDVIGTSGECTFTTLDNQGPIIAGLNNQTGQVGELMCDAFTVTDPGGSVVSVTADNGATIEDNGGGNYIVCYTPAALGVTVVTVTATDDEAEQSTAPISFTAAAVEAPPYTPPFVPEVCPPDEEVAAANVDQETVCWTTTAGGDTIFTGTIRHDDTLPPPGWTLFDQNTTPVSPAEPGLTFVPCDTCCPVVVSDNLCADEGNGSFGVTSMRMNDGTIMLLSQVDGHTVDQADIIQCFVTLTAQAKFLAAGQTWTPPVDVVDTLVSVTLQTLTGTTDLVDQSNTASNNLPAGIRLEWHAHGDQNNLIGPDSITTDAASTAIVSWTERS